MPNDLFKFSEGAGLNEIPCSAKLSSFLRILSSTGGCQDKNRNGICPRFRTELFEYLSAIHFGHLALKDLPERLSPLQETTLETYFQTVLPPENSLKGRQILIVGEKKEALHLEEVAKRIRAYLPKRGLDRPNVEVRLLLTETAEEPGPRERVIPDSSFRNKLLKGAYVKLRPFDPLTIEDLVAGKVSAMRPPFGPWERSLREWMEQDSNLLRPDSTIQVQQLNFRNTTAIGLRALLRHCERH